MPTAEALKIRRTPIKKLFRCTALADREVARFKDWFKKSYGYPHDRAAKGEIATGIYLYTIGNQEALDGPKARVKGKGFVIQPWTAQKITKSSGLFWEDHPSLGGLLKTRQGNCIAFTALYCMLAEELGIEARPVELEEHITPAYIRSDGLPVLFEREKYSLGQNDAKKERGEVRGKEVLVTSRLRNKAFTLRELGRHKEALGLYDRALKISPRNPFLLMGKGITLSDLGCPEEGLDSLDRALVISPDHPSILVNKGAVLSDFGRHKEALEHFDRAIKLGPKNALALSNKADTLMTLGRSKAALKAAERALKLDPKLAHAVSTKGWALSAMGRHEEAIELAKKAVTLDPRDNGLKETLDKVLKAAVQR